MNEKRVKLNFKQIDEFEKDYVGENKYDEEELKKESNNPLLFTGIFNSTIIRRN